MDANVYSWMNTSEQNMWWYYSVHQHMLRMIERFGGEAEIPLLDAGCGTGGLLGKIAAAWPARPLFGLDAEEAAVAAARKKSHAEIVLGDVNKLPYPDQSFGAICSVDVLYHAKVNPAVALREAKRCLKPGGVIILNLPAYQWLYSFHDREGHGIRRFTLGGAREMLAAAGLEPVYATYWNTILFPLMVLQRKFGKSDVGEFPALANTIFKRITDLERLGLRAGLRLPFGGSVLIVGRRAS